MRTIKVAVAFLFGAVVVFVFTARSMAYPAFVGKAKKFGAKDCTFCHVEPEGGPPWNARGSWLVKEKERRGADLVDVDWLADYKPESEMSARTDSPPVKAVKKDQPQAPGAAGAGSVESELLRLEREWLDAYDKRDVAAMERIEGDDFVIVHTNGEVLTKADEIANLKKPGPPGPPPQSTTEGSKVRIYGDTAIINGIFIQKSVRASGPAKGKEVTTRARYTDVYVKRDGRWQVVSSQLTAIRQPPALAQGVRFDVDTPTLDTYVGHYELPWFRFAVTRQGSRLFGQPEGDVQEELVPISATEFLVGRDRLEETAGATIKNVVAKITFLKNDTGAVTGIKVDVDGRLSEGRKIR